MPQCPQCFLSCCESDCAPSGCSRMLLRQQLQMKIRIWTRPPQAGKQPQTMVTGLSSALGPGSLSRHSGLSAAQQVGPFHTIIPWAFDSAAVGAFSNKPSIRAVLP